MAARINESRIVRRAICSNRTNVLLLRYSPPHTDAWLAPQHLMPVQEAFSASMTPNVSPAPALRQQKHKEITND